jgi:hypothetical protein
VHFLTHDVEINGKTLRKGNQLMRPQGRLHFGTQAYRGSGTMCPGRDAVKQTRYALVAMLLHSFDLVTDLSGPKFLSRLRGSCTFC